MKAAYNRFLINQNQAVAEDGKPLRSYSSTAKPKNGILGGLDLSKLENIDDNITHYIARCPACAEAGQDKKGNHLFLGQEGYGCIAFEGEHGSEHRKRIKRLAGAKTTLSQEELDAIEIKRRKEKESAQEAKAFEEKAKSCWEENRERLIFKAEGLLETTGGIPDPAGQFKLFCGLFQPTDLIWAGGLYDSRKHFFNPAQAEEIYPTLEKEGACITRGIAWSDARRLKENMKALRFRVVELEHGTKEEQIAFILFAKELQLGELKMIIWTGGKSFHGIFDQTTNTPVKTIQALIATGADKNALSAGATRVPGITRVATEKTPGGAMQSIAWLPKN